MFTGIIETMGTLTRIEREGGNVHYSLSSNITHELKIDQSLAHNGVCLTVVAIDGDQYKVTAIQETLDKTALKQWTVGDKINLERAMRLGDRLDGHLVQGHVDEVATCISVEDQEGSWLYRFTYSEDSKNMTIEKGSICVNGTSLTVVGSEPNSFGVAIIPYTYEHTVFHLLQIGDLVNIEFDMVGKYIAKIR
ncbi:MAG: riboflavin synthase [Flavobacteriaceae bacterium]|nr:riboflavin synthase [Flavobacteriaceae bacterium]|tara:strand:- start:3363 stop:3941 length:579 start_codon:yes stop_codon:yes gene_type:complete